MAVRHSFGSDQRQSNPLIRVSQAEAQWRIRANPGVSKPARDMPLSRRKENAESLRIFMKIWCQSVLSQARASSFSTFVQR